MHSGEGTMGQDAAARDRAILAIFRDSNACQNSGGRLLFSDLRQAWTSGSLAALTDGLTALITQGYIELEVAEDGRIYTLTPEGLLYAQSLFNPLARLGAHLTWLKGG